MLRSPVAWIGGKFYSAARIVALFPHHSLYDSYIEPFGGGAHVLMQKPSYKHYELFNDANGDLINFWLQCRDHAEELESRLETLPYSRQLYQDYHASLKDTTMLEPLERAIRWFYVLRSSFLPKNMNVLTGWKSGTKRYCRSCAYNYHHPLSYFQSVSERMKYVEIDNRDFEYVINRANPRTLIYCDPPYVDHESYYQNFTIDDHRRLAEILNATPAYVSLSYYNHSLLDYLYPADKWCRVTWKMPKHSQRTESAHDNATEILLMNYRPNNQPGIFSTMNVQQETLC